MVEHSAPSFYFYLLVIRWAHFQAHLLQCCCKPRATRPIDCWLKSQKWYYKKLFFKNWIILGICYSGGELTSIVNLSDKDLKINQQRNLRRDESWAIDIWFLPAVLRALTVSKRHALKQASWEASRKLCYLCIVCSLPFILQPSYYLLSFKKHLELLC